MKHPNLPNYLILAGCTDLGMGTYTGDKAWFYWATLWLAIATLINIRRVSNAGNA